MSISRLMFIEISLRRSPSTPPSESMTLLIKLTCSSVKSFTRISALGVEEQRVNVLIDLDEPRERWAALGDGFRVEAGIEVWRTADALRVPAGAVFRHDAGWAVFRVRDRRAALTPVRIGRRSGIAAQVLGGLEPQDRVVVYPGDNVVDGVRVEGR